MSERSFLSWRKKSMVAVFLLLVAPCSCKREAKVEPVGKSVGVMQFDATIEIDPPLSPNCVVLFARYWVSSNYYRVAVIWAEPHGSGLWFPIYPPTLRVASDPDSFSVTDDLFPKNNATYKKRVGDRGVFVNMYGDYPVGNLRFADQEAYAGRLYQAELSNIGDDEPGATDSLCSIRPTNLQTNREITAFKIKEQNEEIESLKLFGAEGRLLKQCDYEYDNDVSAPGIARERVSWPERPIKTGFREGAVHVKVAQTNFDFNTFLSTYETGGRIATVDYRPIAFGSTIVRLPVRITVRTGQGGEIVRSAQMTNFDLVQMTTAEADRAASEFAGFTPAEKQYRFFSREYRQKTPDQVAVADVSAIKRLCEHFEAVPRAESSDSLGEELKRADIVMDLSRIVGDEPRIARRYERYLSTLAANGLTNMIFDAGYSPIQTAAEWNRYEEADNLLNRWIEFVVRTVDIETVIKFVARQASHGNLWSGFKLLDRFEEKRCPSAALRFQRIALQCLILDALIEQSKSNERPKGVTSKGQFDWAAHETSSDQLEKLLDECVPEAFANLNKVQKLSPFDKALKVRLDLINKRLTDSAGNRRWK
jgi:hypothetical protein